MNNHVVAGDFQMRMLNINEVAEALDCSVMTVRRMIDRSTIPAPTTIGERLIRWDEAALERWIAAGCPTDLDRIPCGLPPT
jgi:excisionase family DNA binding protein